ncbi:MAG: HAD family hydrolase [Candidatus Aminicenantes bacterium]|nr:HAD family hydrolase [Candidatus Aminicenantes bacterium]
MDKLLIILDLDETMVFSTLSPLNRREDFQIDQYHVYRRPYSSDFILFCLDNFRVAVWSSSSTAYAEAMVDQIFSSPQKLDFIWSREQCTQRIDPETGQHFWLKNLKKIKRRGYNLDRVLMIDDSPEKLQKNYGNHLLVRPFLGDESDDELLYLNKYLESIKETENIRSLDKRGWRNQHFL